MSELTQAQIYAAYREKVFSYLKGRLDSHEDAEDLCQTVFLKVFQSLPRYDAQKASLSTWIYQITRFTLIDYLRTRRQEERISEELTAADDLEASLIQSETLDRLAAALAALDEDMRDIILLHYYKGLPLAEVSRLTGIGYGMVKVKHNKALSLLRTQLQ